MPPRETISESGSPHADILESAGIAVMTIDATGTLLEVNDAGLAMFGQSSRALIGRNVSVLMPGYHARAHDGHLRHHLETGEARILGRGRKAQGKRADGSLFPVHLAVGRFEVDGKSYFTGIVHDLSEPERAEEAETRLGHIVEESVNEIYVFAVDTLRFTIVNRGAAANLGYSVAELHAMTPVDIMPSYDEAMFLKLIEPLQRGDAEYMRFQTVHERRDGTRYDVEIVLHLSDAVASPEYVAMVQDVSERNRTLEAFHRAQKMESIGQLTGGIAHDFNNLLTVIGGNLELQAMDPMSKDAGELVEEARAATRRGAALTNRLLSFAGCSGLSPESLDLNELVIELATLLRRSLGGAVSLDLALAPRLPPAMLDASLVESALLNLAINARDAMGGRGELVIETGMRSLDAAAAGAFGLPPGVYVTLGVVDDGAGIAAENLARIFDPFFTTKLTTGGHGLGLSMVHGFARQSGGHVTIESTPGQGTRFTLLLPSAAAHERSSIASVRTGGPERQRRRLILVVEDDAPLRRLTVRRVRHLGHDTLEAADGPSALAMIETHSEVELLLTDMVMPNGMSGLELARQLRERRPALPILITSGHSEELLSGDVLHDERIALLRKPYDGNALAMALHALLAAEY